MASRAGRIGNAISHVRSRVRTKIYRSIRAVHPQFGYRESDIVVAGFPKSGNNWVDFLIANAMVKTVGRNDDIHFRNHNDWIPSGSHTSPKPTPVEGVPRMLSTHDAYHGQRTRAVYIVRHPADVMESYHHYRKHRWNEDVGPFSEFIRTDEWGVRAWKRHVESWEGNWDVLVKFEELKRDPKEQLRRICALWDREIDESTLKYAVDRSSFETMKRMEEEYGLKRRPGANPDYTFMRSGTADQGEAVFEESDYRYLERVVGELMDRYGYETPV